MYKLLIVAALMVPTIAHAQTKYEMPIQCDSVSVGGQAFSCADTKHLYYKSYRGTYILSSQLIPDTDTSVYMIADNNRVLAFSGNAIKKQGGHSILYVNRLLLTKKGTHSPTIAVTGICDIELERGVMKQGTCTAQDIDGVEVHIEVHGNGLVKQVEFNSESVQ